jgi:5-methylcytosine-specific restriction enzyme A
MPTSARHACAVSGCGVLLGRGEGSRCVAHRPANSWARDRPVPVRIRGRQLQRLRAALFDRSPLCVACDRAGRVTVATIRDHVIPLAEGGRDVERNVQALCQTCSDAKTADEARRGMARRSRT